MSEAKNAEAELAKVIRPMLCEKCPKCEGAGWVWRDELDRPNRGLFGGADDTKYSCDLCGPLTGSIARAILAAGYRKRSDVLEEGVQALRGCAYDLGFDPVLGPGGCLLEGEGQRGCVCMGVASALRELKGRP